MPRVETAGPIDSFRRTYVAAAAGQGRGLALIQAAGQADNVAAVVAAANAPAVIGFQEENSINAGDPISVVREKEVVAVGGAVITAGQFLITDAQGRLVPSAAAGDNVCAQAISSTVAIGDFLLVQVVKFIR
jgi:hypothetical protein